MSSGSLMPAKKSPPNSLRKLAIFSEVVLFAMLSKLTYACQTIQTLQTGGSEGQARVCPDRLYYLACSLCWPLIPVVQQRNNMQHSVKGLCTITYYYVLFFRHNKFSSAILLKFTHYCMLVHICTYY